MRAFSQICYIFPLSAPWQYVLIYDIIKFHNYYLRTEQKSANGDQRTQTTDLTDCPIRLQKRFVQKRNPKRPFLCIIRSAHRAPSRKRKDLYNAGSKHRIYSRRKAPKAQRIRCQKKAFARNTSVSGCAAYGIRLRASRYSHKQQRWVQVRHIRFSGIQSALCRHMCHGHILFAFAFAR